MMSEPCEANYPQVQSGMPMHPTVKTRVDHRVDMLTKQLEAAMRAKEILEEQPQLGEFLDCCNKAEIHRI